MSARVVDALLRDPAEVVTRCRRAEGMRELSTTSLVCLMVGAAIFGGVVGSYRGGWQVAFSAVKLPLALTATLVVCVPAFHALTIALGGRSSFATTASLTLSAAARAALVLLGCAPLMWLAVDWNIGYHHGVLLACGMYFLSGLAAVAIVLRGLGGSWRALATAAACGVVFFSVLGQTAWMLRPFFGRPAQQHIPFVRAREGTLADSIVTSSRSARGVYDTRRHSRAAPTCSSRASMAPEAAECVGAP